MARPGARFFSQGLMVLCGDAPSLDDIGACVETWAPRRLPPGDGRWIGDQPQLVLAGPQGRGTVRLDVIPEPWPDHMADADDTSLLGAWTMGFLGTFTWPRGLARSVQHAHRWSAAPEVVPRHRSFIRLLVTYIQGADRDQPVVPAGYSPIDELRWLTPLWRALCSVPGSLCAFNPSGEVLLDPSTFDQRLDAAEQEGRDPIDLWVNVRLHRLDDHRTLVDTVGLGQLDLQDMEAVYEDSAFDASSVAQLMWDLCWYAASTSAVFGERDTVDGPGGRWRAEHVPRAFAEPLRPTIRWSPAR
jgi:hypothetical protein